MPKLTVCRASAGTGKTYTLAARYIALLMDSDSDLLYRNILAVTFTNKATAEMKSRIISYLYLIAEGDKNEQERVGFIANMTGFMVNKSMTDADLTDKAKRVYHHILDDYENMKVTTIDSFLQTLVNGMAHHIGIGAGFGVVLDSKHLIADAVDEIMTSGVLSDAKVRDLLTAYVEELLDEEKKWDVRDNLISMGQEMLRESVQQDDANIVSDPDIITKYRKKLQAMYATAKAKLEAEYNKFMVCEIGYNKDGDNPIIDHGSTYYNFVNRVRLSLEGLADSDKLYKGLTETQVVSLSSDKFLKKINNPADAVTIQSALIEMDKLCPILKKEYYRKQVLMMYLNDLAMMGFLKGNVDNILEETNSILLARTAYALSQALKPGDADFILEKSGIRYSHVMIDEFQDTSTLQWDIFKSLVEEILSAGGTTLIVGDVKQSIYRWRNGDYRIMEGLSQNTPRIGGYFDVNAKPLTRNFRSQANVVRFNLNLFKKLIADGGFAHEYENLYKEGPNGYEEENLASFHNCKYDNGYVQYRAYPVLKTIPPKEMTEEQRSIKTLIVVPKLEDDMFKDIETLIDKGESPSSIMILIRKNKQIPGIIEGYNRSGLSKKGVRICSNDSFLLETSMAVQKIINCLKVIVKSDSIAKEYLAITGVTEEHLQECSVHMPLYELVENVVCKALSKDGMLDTNEAPYLNCFMDSVRNYVEAYGSDAKAFLTYWDDELHEKAIPASDADGIRIMTIHSSKGLESKHLFIPYCTWTLEENKGANKSTIWLQAQKLPLIGNKSLDEHNDKEVELAKIPVEFSANIKECGYDAEYEEEKKAICVDNLNLLYVALTRAAESLYVYAAINYRVPKIGDEKNVGELIFNCLKDEKVASGKTLEEEYAEVFANCEKNTPVYAQYTLGTVCNVPKKGSKNALSPFEYKYSDKEVRVCGTYVTNDNISFRQSQESVLYTQGASEKAEAAQKRIDAGILRHNIFSEIVRIADTDKILDKYYTKGLIETKEELRLIREEFDTAWNNPQMSSWFSGDWKLLREVAILRPQSEYNAEVEEWKKLPLSERGQMPQRELRPDRVMIKDNKAVVLDFKFGKQNHDKYSKQIEKYTELLKKMGYTDVEGYLWYGFDNELKPVN